MHENKLKDKLNNMERERKNNKEKYIKELEEEKRKHQQKMNELEKNKEINERKYELIKKTIREGIEKKKNSNGKIKRSRA